MARISVSSILGKVPMLFILRTVLFSVAWHLEGEGIVSSPLMARAEDHVLIQFHLFRAAVPQSQAGTPPAGILTAAEHPELASLMEAAPRSDKE
ncbi:MAG: hypothetical protein ABFD80_08590, partial [Acidobacteriota bacterium]